MKKKSSNLTILLSVITSISFGQISAGYPNDLNIQSHPNVILTEMFEQASYSALMSNAGYSSLTMTTHIGFAPTVPAGSLGNQSLKLRTVETSTLSNDPNEDSNLLIKFPNAINDSVFVRYYVKYNNNFTFHHSGLWLGGTNTTFTCWPCCYANQLADGDSAFRIGSEIRGATMAPQNNAKFGLYNYWMGQHPAGGTYLANNFDSPSPNANIDMTAWNCIEVMLKLNNPVTDSTGEVALWINGIKIAHYGKNFPNGTWNQNVFNEGAGSPFEGFRWRKNNNVKFNSIWIKNYSTNNISNAPNDIFFDHVVVAKSYIGPIALPTTISGLDSKNKSIQLFPNPTNDLLFFSETLKDFKIYNMLGELVIQKTEVSKSVSTSNLMDGIYFLHADNSVTKFIVKH